MTTTTGPVHDDGFGWVRGTLSNPDAWSLRDPDGWRTAHVYQARDRTWYAVWDHGEVIAAGLPTSGAALRAADNVARPCAHGEPCAGERAHGSRFCPNHDVAVRS